MIALADFAKNPHVSSTLNSAWTPQVLQECLKEWVNDSEESPGIYSRTCVLLFWALQYTFLHLSNGFGGAACQWMLKTLSLAVGKALTCLLKPALCSSASATSREDPDMGTTVSTRVPLFLKTHLSACQGVSCDTRAHNVQSCESPALCLSPAPSQLRMAV